MKLTITSEKEKLLVERVELEAKIENFASTPSNAQVQEEISKQLNKPKELVVVKRIRQQFGKNEANALVYIYNSVASLKKFEPKKKEKKATAVASAAESSAPESKPAQMSKP